MQNQAAPNGVAAHNDHEKQIESSLAVDDDYFEIVLHRHYTKQGAMLVLNLALHAIEFHQLSPIRQFLLAIQAGAFIAIGAALAVIFSNGVEAAGPEKLLEGLGFVIGFASVIYSGAALFTEVNVALPAFLLTSKKFCLGCLQFWVLVFFGNLAGAALVAVMIDGADVLNESQLEQLGKIIAKKNAHLDDGAAGWFTAVISGILANWLVGMAAVFATLGKSMTEKFIGLVLPVLAFAALGVQHSPANMGLMFIALVDDRFTGVTFVEAMFQNIVPAAIGNMIGAFVLDVLLMYFVYIYKSGFKDNMQEILAQYSGNHHR